MDAASTICPNPTEGVFKYTVVTSGRPVVDGLHHGDLPVPADFLRSKQGPEARLGKRQLAKLTSCGVLPPVKGRDLKLHSFKKPSIHPLDPTEMSDYSPRTTTFVNGRPSSSVSTPKHHPFTPTSAAGALAGPSHASPDSVRDGSATTRDDLEDVASVDSAPGAMRFLTTRARDSLPGGLQPEAVPASARLALSRFPHDLSTTDESLDMYLEQFFPELHSMSDAELLRLMDPNPSAPSLPTRSSTLAILQDMLLTQGTYAAPSLKQHNSTASNPPSSNWSSMASDEHNSHNWSEAPSQNWRSPRSPSPGPANWMSWPSATQQQQSRKRQRALDGAEDMDWPALAEHAPALSGEVPPSKRQMLQHRPLGMPQHAGAEHGSSPALDRHLLYAMPSSAAAAAPPQAHEAAPRPNPFASVSKQALLQPGQLHRQPLDLQSYMSLHSSATAHSHRLGCSPTLASSGESVSCSRGSALEHTIEPASVLEQALRDLRSKPEAHVC